MPIKPYKFNWVNGERSNHGYRSVEINKLRYIEYVGDGDTSSCKDVKDSNPYQNEISIVKRECLVHV